MEWPLIFWVILVATIGLSLSAALSRLLRRGRHKMTRAGLKRRAFRESEALVDFVNERETSRPIDDAVIKDHQHPHRRVTLHDEETHQIYARDYLPEIAELREQFARRGIRNDALDRVYEDAENEGDLRTVSTALVEMAKRLG